MSKNVAVILNVPNEMKEAFDEISENAQNVLNDQNNILISRKEAIPTIAEVFIDQLLDYAATHDTEINFFELINFRTNEFAGKNDDKNDNMTRSWEFEPGVLAYNKLKKDNDDEE